MLRVVVVGVSGSGKTTLARWLAASHALPFTDLDDVFWRPRWQRAGPDEFRSDVDRLTSQTTWVLAGNYSSARDLIWPRADTLIWLDLPMHVSLWRTTRRVIRQAHNGEPICNGNRQSVGALFFGRDPLLWYSIKAARRYRRQWPRVLAAPEHAHLRTVRLRSVSAVTAWMNAA